MTDAPDANQTAAPSQVIEHREADASALGRGPDMTADAPKEEAKPKEDAKPLSSRDAISKAMSEVKSKAEKASEEAPDAEAEKEEPKAEAQKKKLKDEAAPAEVAKEPGEAKEPAEKAPASAPDRDAGKADDASERQSEGRKYAEPPSRFLPEARAKWANTPNEIKAEMHRVSQEFEAQTRDLSERAEKYEAVRRFDEMARQSGTTLDQALERYVSIEQKLATNWAEGVAEILRNFGMTPQQYAQYVMQNPQAQQPRQAAQQPQQQRSDPQVQQLSQELKSLKTELAAAKVQPVVEQFASRHADYPQLESHIAEILRSGVIEGLYGSGLTPGQRLEQAYRMAGGRGSPSQSEAPAPAPAAAQAQPDRLVDPDGQKSVRGAPGAGQSTAPQRQFKTNRDALKAAFAAARQ
jgi:hypothetical protein